MEILKTLNYYDISPMLVPVGKTTTVRITNRDGSARYSLEGLSVSVHAMDGPMLEWECDDICPSRFASGAIEFEVTPEAMSEYRVSLRKPGQKIREGIELRFFALDEDVYGRLPLKGDLHVHSTGSDGTENPALVAANYRRSGYDFFSTTDHANFNSSGEVIDTYKDVSLGMTLMRGEECHCPGNDVHIVNFGGTESVSDLYRSYGDGFRPMIEEFAKTLEIPESARAYSYMYAATIWEARAIRRFGGLAIYPHPYWESYIYNVPTALSRALLESGEFDAFELYGGQSVRENNYQTLLWGEELSRGVKLPVVGSSDSHQSVRFDNFGSMLTIVYARSASREDILDAVRGGYCSAVELRRGELPRVSGSLRLGMLTYFLLERFYPFHDDVCFGEGVLMHEYARGNNRERARSLLEASAGRSMETIKELY